MNLVKKAALFLLAGIMMVMFGSCGPTKVDTSTPEAAINTAAEKMTTAKSLNSTLIVDMDVVVGDNTSSQQAKSEISHIYEPVAIKIVNIVDSGTEHEDKMENYAIEDNGRVVAYKDYAGRWTKQTVGKEELQNAWQIYDTKDNAITLLNAATNVEETGRADKIITLKGEIPAENVQEVAEETRAFQMMGLSDLTDEYFEGVPKVEIQFTMDETTGVLTGYQVDYTPALQKILENVNHFLYPEAAQGDAPQGTTVSKYSITVQCADFDKVEKITVPQTVLNSAIDYTQPSTDTTGSESSEPEQVEDVNTQSQETIEDVAEQSQETTDVESDIAEEQTAE